MMADARARVPDAAPRLDWEGGGGKHCATLAGQGKSCTACGRQQSTHVWLFVQKHRMLLNAPRSLHPLEPPAPAVLPLQIGFREGIDAGKETQLQAGFNAGFIDGIRLGLLKGQLSALVTYVGALGTIVVCALQPARADDDIELATPLVRLRRACIATKRNYAG